MPRRIRRTRSELLAAVTVDGDLMVVATTGGVRVHDRRSLSASASNACQWFLQGVLAVDEVQSVEIHHQRGFATIGFAVEQQPGEVLRRLANALRRRLASPLGGIPLLLAPDRRVTRLRRRSVRAPAAALPADRDPGSTTGVVRLIHLTLAAGSFGMAVAGAVLPGIPTVPFLLLTSYFLVRSSPALNRRLLRSRLFGRLIRDWQQHRAIRPHIKRNLLILMFATATVSIVFGDLAVPAQLGVLVAVGISAWAITRLPTPPAARGPGEAVSTERAGEPGVGDVTVSGA